MKFRRLFWKLFLRILLLVTLSTAGALTLSSISVQKLQFQRSESELEWIANLVQREIAAPLVEKNDIQVQSLIQEIGAAVPFRLTVVRPNGEVVADSFESPREMDNHLDRPEITQALQGVVGKSFRFGKGTQEKRLYLAVPVVGPFDEIIGVVRSTPPSDQPTNDDPILSLQLLIWIMLIIGLVAFMSWKFSHRLSAPIESLRSYAQKISRGDFSSRVRFEEEDPREFHDLGRFMNKIAIDLLRQVDVMVKQSDIQKAILLSMKEGVIAIDSHERVTHLNRSAELLLDSKGRNLKGLALHEAIRNSDLNGLVHQVLQNGVRSKKELEFVSGDKLLQISAQVNPLFDQGHSNAGVVIVLNDVTDLKEFERRRKEFVANVSHELKTPLTSIRGFAETLLRAKEGGPTHQEFLKIIVNHAKRLDAIVDDLLMLSKIEKDEKDPIAIALSPEPLAQLIQDAVELCQTHAQEKRQTLSVQCAPDLLAHLNRTLFVQALVNLVHNAVKYSPEESTIEIFVTQKGSELILSVRDQGPGIPEEHQNRIFERFYRVDSGRSREVGGTGLGLAIVKHIVNIHHGSVGVKSTPGQGCEFWIGLTKI